MRPLSVCPPPAPLRSQPQAAFKRRDRPQAGRSGPAPRGPPVLGRGRVWRLSPRPVSASGCLAATSPRPTEPVGATCLPPTQEKEEGDPRSGDAREPPTPGGRAPGQEYDHPDPRQGSRPTMPFPQGTEKASSGSVAETTGSS